MLFFLLFLITLSASYFSQFYFHLDVRAQLQPHEDFVFTANDARTVLASYHRRNLTDTDTHHFGDVPPGVTVLDGGSTCTIATNAASCSNVCRAHTTSCFVLK